MQTQYLTYRTLLDPIAGQGISEAEAKDILRQVLRHLSELHDRGQAHGSVSLDTIAYDYSRMEIILLDPNEKNHPIYLAPEISQTQQATPAADIYALGVVIIVLLTGFPPDALQEEDNTWNWQEIYNVSDQFIQILNIALLAEPTSRYVNATAMLRSLQPVINLPESTLTISPNTHLANLLPPTSIQNSKVNLSNCQIYRNVKDISNKANNKSITTNKGIIRILITMFLGVGITLSSAVGSYFYMLSKSTSIANTTKKNLEFANVEDQSMDKAIANTYEMTMADQNGKILSQWEENIKQKLGKETKDETLQAVIKTFTIFKSIAPTPYGQLSGKEIIEEQPKLNSSVVTTSPLPVTTPLPNVESLNNPITETYNPPTETYSPPTETYSPPQESSSPPLPPAPRVAN